MTNASPLDSKHLDYVLTRAERLVARIGSVAESGCWPWLGGHTYNGYGSVTISIPGGGYASIRAHRAVFMLHHQRAIADGMTLHHTCFNRGCVNPGHLVEMSQADNTAVGAWGGASIRKRTTKAGVPRWMVLFRADGKQRSRTFGSEEAAQAFIEERRASVAA